MRALICPVCNSNNVFLFMEGIFDCQETQVMECDECGLQFLNPMMSDIEETEYYYTYYENQKNRQFKKFSLKDIQYNAFSHYKEYDDIYFDLIKNANDILEIGSGSGGFLRYIKQNINPNKIISIERSKANLDFLTDTSQNNFNDVIFLNDLDELKINSKFDLIVAFGVFEHIKKGSSFLETLRKFLKNNNSRVVLSIPNKRNPLIDIYNIDQFKKFNYMKQHYYTYSEKSLEILAQKAGYNLEKFEYMQVWGLDNHISWLKTKKPNDFSKYTNILSEKTLKAYKEDLIQRKITDLMMVILNKN